jgi:hypothetical protein
MSVMCVRPAPQAHGLPSTLQVIGAFYSSHRSSTAPPFGYPCHCGYLLTIVVYNSSGTWSESSLFVFHGTTTATLPTALGVCHAAGTVRH